MKKRLWVDGGVFCECGVKCGAARGNFGLIMSVLGGAGRAYRREAFCFVDFSVTWA